jgi:hypothetical protein
MTMKISGTIFTILVLGIFFQGCATTPPEPFGTRSAVFSQDVLNVSYTNTLHKTFEASRAALEKLDIAITNASKETAFGAIDAVRRDGTVVNLSFRAQKPDITDVRIRVGTYGSEELSRNISRAIETELRRN